MKRLFLILLIPTVLIADITRLEEDRRLPYWPEHILSGEPKQLDEYFRILLKEIRDLYNDIAVTVNLGIDLDNTDIRYFGTMDANGDYADGDWRIIKVSSDDFEIQKKISGTWTQQAKWSVASGLEMTNNITAGEFIDGSYDSTDWISAYTKRVDTWTLPLLLTANVASLSVANTYMIVGNVSGVGVAVAISGDIAITNTGVVTIQPDSVALTTDTTGNYVASITNGTSITGGDGGSEGADLTLDIADDSVDGTELADTITIDGTELDLDGDVEITGQFKLSTSSPPATASSTGEQGDIQWDSSYIYVCVAANTWKRAALSTWTSLEKIIYNAEDVIYAGEDIYYNHP